MRVSMASVRPTLATASAPSRETQKISTIAKSDSMAISRIIGTASNKIARRIGTSVKSCRLPRSASRTDDQKLDIGRKLRVMTTRWRRIRFHRRPAGVDVLIINSVAAGLRCHLLLWHTARYAKQECSQKRAREGHTRRIEI